MFVPYINKSTTRTLILILIGSLAARGIGYVIGLKNDPWTYRFFPFELMNFVIGMLGWRIYRKYSFDKFIPYFTKKSSFLLCVLAVLAVMFLHLKFTELMLNLTHSKFSIILCYSWFLVLIPILFAFSRSSAVDRFIGELSYPIYLMHYILIPITSIFLKKLHIPIHLGLAVALTTIGVSLLMLQLVLQPFDAWRHRFITAMATRRQALEALST